MYTGKTTPRARNFANSGKFVKNSTAPRIQKNELAETHEIMKMPNLKEDEGLRVKKGH